MPLKVSGACGIYNANIIYTIPQKNIPPKVTLKLSGVLHKHRTTNELTYIT